MYLPCIAKINEVCVKVTNCQSHTDCRVQYMYLPCIAKIHEVCVKVTVSLILAVIPILPTLVNHVTGHDCSSITCMLDKPGIA
jgi:hypothetical protein